MARYWFKDNDTNREEVLSTDIFPLKNGELLVDLFQDGLNYKIIDFDPQPFNFDGDIVEGGRVWVRRAR